MNLAGLELAPPGSRLALCSTWPCALIELRRYLYAFDITYILRYILLTSGYGKIFFFCFTLPPPIKLRYWHLVTPFFYRLVVYFRTKFYDLISKVRAGAAKSGGFLRNCCLSTCSPQSECIMKFGTNSCIQKWQFFCVFFR